MESAQRLPQAPLLAQGTGKLQLGAALALLRTYRPHLSSWPPSIDLVDCPWAPPGCEQPLYSGALPRPFNLTLLGGGVPLSLRLLRCLWLPADPASARHLLVTCLPPDRLWPWSAPLSVWLTVRPSAQDWRGLVSGRLRVEAAGGLVLHVPLRAEVVPTPPRSRRLLWDGAHQLRYPHAYVPRDALGVRPSAPSAVPASPFDARGDHPHTNYALLWTQLRAAGYYLEVLSAPALSCLRGDQYGALLVVDPEDWWHPEEQKALVRHVSRGLSLLVLADWYAPSLLKHPHLRFWDENTRRWWAPVCSGAHVPALNLLLGAWGAALGEGALDGRLLLPGRPPIHLRSAAPIVQWPKGGRLITAELVDQVAELQRGVAERQVTAVLGLLQTEGEPLPPAAPNSTGPGRLVVLSDSSCADDLHDEPTAHCRHLLPALLTYACTGVLAPDLALAAPELRAPFVSRRFSAPQSRPDEDPLRPFSRTLPHALGSLAPLLAALGAGSPCTPKEEGSEGDTAEPDPPPPTQGEGTVSRPSLRGEGHFLVRPTLTSAPSPPWVRPLLALAAALAAMTLLLLTTRARARTRP